MSGIKAGELEGGLGKEIKERELKGEERKEKSQQNS